MTKREKRRTQRNRQRRRGGRTRKYNHGRTKRKSWIYNYFLGRV